MTPKKQRANGENKGTFERNYNIVNLCNRGYTLQSVADYYEITKEAARQIRNHYEDLYDAKFELKSAYKNILPAKSTKYFYDNQYWSLRNLIKHCYPNKKYKEITSIENSIKHYAQKSKSTVSECLFRYIKTGEEFWRKDEFVYRGKKYKYRSDLYKELFPNIDPDDINSAIQQRKRYWGISFEEALKQTIEKGYPTR